LLLAFPIFVLTAGEERRRDAIARPRAEISMECPGSCECVGV
jgi:hypothetical protein